LDEPTTGLDVITQRGVLDLVGALREELGLAAVLVSHDLGVVAHMADEVCVLRAGRVVEAAPTRRLFAAPADPYTRRLLASVPRIADAGLALVGEDGTREIRPKAEVPGDAAEALDVREVTIDYGTSRAVDGVSFSVRKGEVLALVGESGSGKSTVAATLLGHLRHGSRLTGGRVAVEGRDVFALSARELRRLRGGTVAMVSQNAGHALTPSMRIGRQIAEAGGEVPVTDLLEQVRLPHPRELARRYPHELSGGQQQRVAIAMAIA
ncbi:ATP-binding cassette domain-containing protein, partial [Streptomyces antimycoticus]|uniref:ATP-binding cassette domain-containing protein n=1 Tax=Streptomyces antimycoticus TaxID=68175 RepID=UPI00117DAA85